jgi:hypothetical protein
MALSFFSQQFHFVKKDNFMARIYSCLFNINLCVSVRIKLVVMYRYIGINVEDKLYRMQLKLIYREMHV